jgi:hypothetical protein
MRDFPHFLINWILPNAYGMDKGLLIVPFTIEGLVLDGKGQFADWLYWRSHSLRQFQQLIFVYKLGMYPQKLAALILHSL